VTEQGRGGGGGAGAGSRNDRAQVKEIVWLPSRFALFPGSGEIAAKSSVRLAVYFLIFSPLVFLPVGRTRFFSGKGLTHLQL
jgi:hypothetical protein